MAIPLLLMENAMKKRIIILTLVVLAAVAAVFVGLNANRALLVSEEPAIGREPERDFLSVSAQLSKDAQHASGDMHLTATNRTGAQCSEVVLRLYANGVQEGSMTISSVLVGESEADWSLDQEDPSVLRIRTAWAPEKTLEIAWHFEMTLPEVDGFIGMQDGVGLYIGALPVLAMWEEEDGEWRTDAWDALAEPSYAQAFDVSLALTVPSGVQVATGASLVHVQENADGTRTLSAQMQGARDVSFAARKGGAIRQKQADGVLVSVLAESGGVADRLLSAAVDALEALSDLGIGYPFTALSVVQADTSREEGLVGSGLIALDAESKGDALLAQMTRLVARQVFGIQVENDPWNAPWLSQSLASAVELLAYRRAKGVDAYEARFYEEIEVSTRLTRPYGVTIGSGVDHFGGDSEMTQVLRDQGAVMLMGIDQSVGEEAFLKALSLYVERNAGGVADFDALEAALYEATGSRWDGYLLDWLAS